MSTRPSNRNPGERAQALANASRIVQGMTDLLDLGATLREGLVAKTMRPEPTGNWGDGPRFIPVTESNASNTHAEARSQSITGTIQRWKRKALSPATRFPWTAATDKAFSTFSGSAAPLSFRSAREECQRWESIICSPIGCCGNINSRTRALARRTEGLRSLFTGRAGSSECSACRFRGVD